MIVFRQSDTLVKVFRILAINNRDLLIDSKRYKTITT